MDRASQSLQIAAKDRPAVNPPTGAPVFGPQLPRPHGVIHPRLFLILCMLLLLSPAKTLDLETVYDPPLLTVPRLLSRAEVLVDALRGATVADLRALMKVSEAIAALNVQRFGAFHTPFDADNARPAGLAFRGDVYRGLGADDFAPAEWRFAQDHLRILSGLYGLLRPLDLIQAYRLEMGTRLAVGTHRNLYQFWGDRITTLLNADVAATGASAVVNLASREYFKALHPTRLAAPVIDVDFKERKGDAYKIVAIYAKVARGRMARYVVREGLTDPEGLKDFAVDGYTYDAAQSGERHWVFSRPFGS